MTRPVILSPVYNALTGNVSMGNLDTTFNQAESAFNELSNCSVFVVDIGAVNALVVNPSPATLNIALGSTLDVLVSSTNTGPVTLTVTGSTGIVGVQPVTDGQGNAMSAGVLVGNTVYRMIYDGTVWRASGTVTGGGTGPVAATTLTASGNTQLNVTTITTSGSQSLTINTSGGVPSLAITQTGGAGAIPAVLIQGGSAQSTGIALYGGVPPAVAGTNTFDIFQLGSSGVAALINRLNTDMQLYTNNLMRMKLFASGGMQIFAPDGVSDTLTLNSPSGGSAAAITINGALGVPKLYFNNTTNTGAATVTLTANKPGGPGTTVAWIPIKYNGNVGYIPIFGP